MEYHKFETGVEYRLDHLFDLDNRIIIPDLQRDYCWGTNTKDSKDLVKGFVTNLIENGFNKSETQLSLGLIYGYEIPQGHIQLCDGQQRVTSLFLLLGMLNKKSNGAFKERLISNKELEDDRETYLQYAIRESSLYFLSDLAFHFFIQENNLFVKDIRKQPWYFGDYDLDPSIQSMLSAMETIEEVIKDIDAVSFGKYLCEELSFVYYDMGNRRNGEETFVIINTTGEPLSATENLKPIFINQQKLEEQEECSLLWEKWDTWFWKYRKGAGEKDNDTSDNGFNEFLRWFALLNIDTATDRFKKIQSGKTKIDLEGFEPSEIDKYFEAVKFLFEDSNILEDNLDWLSPPFDEEEYKNNQIDWFRLLPLVEYVKRFGTSDYRSIIRVKHFFDNISRIDNVSRAVNVLLPKAIEIIKMLPNKDKDIASILDMKDISKQLLSEEEKLKFELYRKAENREELEDRFWAAEDHKIWDGQILSLIKWSSNDGAFQLESFDKFNKVFNDLFHGDLEYEELDIVRRALLTRGLDEYPRMFSGYTNYSFCWEYSDWFTLIKDNEDEFGRFLQELIDVGNIKSGLDKMIRSYRGTNNKLYAVVKQKELLEFCEQKNIQNNGDEGWILLESQKISGAHANLKAYCLYLEWEKLEKHFWNEDWECEFYKYDRTYVRFYHEKKEVIIDILYVGGDKYSLQLLRTDDKESKRYLSKIAGDFGLTWNGWCYKDSRRKGKEGIIALLKKIMKKVEN